MGPREPTGGSLVDDRSGHIYVIDTKTDPEAPSLHKVVHPEDIVQKTGLAYLHISHCLASGDFFSLTQSLMSREALLAYASCLLGTRFFLWAKRKGRFPRLFIIVRRMSDGMKWSAFFC